VIEGGKSLQAVRLAGANISANASVRSLRAPSAVAAQFRY